MTNMRKLYNKAFFLAIFTVTYNVIEGGLSVLFGYSDETLALFGFGADSFIEVISGFGIVMMVIRIKMNPESSISRFEISALRITGFAFCLLSAGLMAGIVLNIVSHKKPETTLWGIIISIFSIFVMIWLMVAKRNTGRRIGSEAIIADANCTKVCVYMSIVLLISSLAYELTGFAYADVIGAAGLIYFSTSEAKEAFMKAKAKRYLCCDQ